METVKNNISVSSSMTQYIEAIYEMSRSNQNVRTTDIALRLGISKPSVNHAVYTLKRGGYVTHEPYGAVVLTEKGRSLGEFAARKNDMIKMFLMASLNLTEDEAECEACRIGHSVSADTVERMNVYISGSKRA